MIFIVLGGSRRRAVVRRWFTVARKWLKMAHGWLTVAHRGTRKSPQILVFAFKNQEVIYVSAFIRLWTWPRGSGKIQRNLTFTEGIKR
jgi:hypothetical protein